MNSAYVGFLRSSIPGRIRWEARDRLCGQPLVAKGVEIILKQTPEIYLVKTNTVSGKLLVKFDSTLSENKATELIRQALQNPCIDAVSQYQEQKREVSAAPAAKWMFDLFTSALRSYIVVSIMRLQ